MKRISTILIVLSITSIGFAQDGFLDPTFNLTGYVETPGSYGSKVPCAVQSDGKIIVAGLNGSNERILVRYDINGSLDTSFGSGGIVTTASNYSDPNDYGYGNATDIVIQPDGKIVFVGTLRTSSIVDAIIIRFNPNGTLDTSFDSNGYITTDIYGDEDNPAVVAIQGDGKIIVGGSTFTGDPDNILKGLVLRYNNDGSLDQSFATNGKLETNLGLPYSTLNEYRNVRAIAIQKDGKILIGGYHSRDRSTWDIAVSRILYDGTADNYFATNGHFQRTACNKSGQVDLALCDNGKIVASSCTTSDYFYTLRLALYPPSGAGTSGAPYIIDSMHDLYWLAVNKQIWTSSLYFDQIADLDASETITWDGGKDWIFIELENPANENILVSRSFFLKNDGSVVDADGSTTTLEMPGLEQADYNIVVRHRNHLGVLSSNPHTCTESTASATLYDFTDQLSKSYGSKGMVELEPGVWGLASADMNQDGRITSTDYVIWFNQLNAGDTGYSSADMDLNGIVNNSDYVYWFSNAADKIVGSLGN